MPSLLTQRHYIPPLRALAFGEGPEMRAVETLADAAGISTSGLHRQGDAGDTLALGQPPRGVEADRWTAILLLFHDHEWEGAILRWAFRTDAFYIGAQGGRRAREARRSALLDLGIPTTDIDRLRSPIGLIPSARDPDVLAMSVLAEIVASYSALHPHS